MRSPVVAAMAALAGFGTGGWGTPLRMEYCVTPSGPDRFDYRIELILDNHDGGWAPGQGFAWIVFGDAQGVGPSPVFSPLNDFDLDPASVPIGPFHLLTITAGYHNGPTLGPLLQSLPPYPLNVWAPGVIGDRLEWRGTSSADLGSGQLRWSNVMGTNGAASAAFEVAVRKECVPCYPDCNHDGALSVADFGCFQTSIAAGSRYGDCNGDAAFTVADFGCFQTRFVLGCP